MSTTYTWNIPDNGLFTENINDKTNVVTLIRYEIDASDGIDTIKQQGNVRLPFDVNAPFIDFYSLTKNDVIGWVQKTLGSEVITQLETMLDKQMEIKKSPVFIPVQTTAPWTPQ
jgi:hypothetical protein